MNKQACVVIRTLVFALFTVTVCADDSWHRFLGASYDGVSKDPGIDWAKPPTTQWVLPVADGYGMGCVGHGKYFHFDAGLTSSRQSAERLRCIDLDTGKTLWSKTHTFFYRDSLGYEDGPRSTPTIHGDHVYSLGVTGILTCRKIADGESVWSVDTNKKYGVVQNFFGVGGSPLILEDELILMIGGSPAADQEIPPMQLDRVSPNGSAVVAFDLKTGKELWKTGDDLASYSSPRPINLAGNTYVLVFAREGLMLVDPREHRVRWRFDHRASKLESVNAMMPVVVDDYVFLSECYEVGSVLLKASPDRFDIVWQDEGGKRQHEWMRQSFRSHWMTPKVINGFLYGGSGRNPPDSDFRCIEFKTGKVKWVDERGIRSTATRIGDHLVVLEERGLVQIIRPNPEKLDVIATWDLGTRGDDRPALEFPCWAAPIVVDNQLLLRGNSNVLCLELHLKE